MSDSPWIRPDPDSSVPLWGIEGGIQVALWPAGIEGPGGGPRGLFRIGYPILHGGTAPGLVNYIAVEPVVGAHRGFSELERSDIDSAPGRVFWSGDRKYRIGVCDCGATTREDGAERLTVAVRIERFANGAHPHVELELRSDRPGEVRFTIYDEEDSAPMAQCILTATMGNYMRLRRLWTKKGAVRPADLWPQFDGEEFTPDGSIAMGDLTRNAAGDVLACAGTDEEDPGSVPPDPDAPWWAYRGSFPLTQYWRKPAGSWTPDLRVRVNGRRRYWATHNPIPGGLAYENFELVERFRPAQTFIFGLSRATPAELLVGGPQMWSQTDARG